MSKTGLIELGHKFLALVREYQAISAECLQLEAACTELARRRSASGDALDLNELERASEELGLGKREERLSVLIGDMDALAMQMVKHRPRTLEEFGALALLTVWAESAPDADPIPAWQGQWQAELKDCVYRIATGRPE